MASFSELIQADKPLLVDFFAEWCGPCHAMKPILENFKKQVGDKLTIIKVDVDKNQAVAATYGIQSIPTFILFKQGKILWRQAGVVNAQELSQALAAYL
ncbi:MAG: thioredoxin [Bacteroidota bacterium]